MYAMYIMAKITMKLGSKMNKTQKKKRVHFKNLPSKHVRKGQNKMTPRSAQIPLKRSKTKMYLNVKMSNTAVIGKRINSSVSIASNTRKTIINQTKSNSRIRERGPES